MPTRIRGVCTDTLIGIFAACILAMPSVVSADAIGRALNECAGIANDSDRLKCFDAVAAMAGGDEPNSEPVTQKSAIEDSAVAAMTSEVAPDTQQDVDKAAIADAVAAPAEDLSDVTGVAAAASASTAQSATVPLTDDFGIERVKGVEREESTEYAAAVTHCERNAQSEQLYFFFENGQVWRQSNYRRLYFRDCRFEVTLAKDRFGYELYIPSKDRTVRVTRIR